MSVAVRGRQVCGLLVAHTARALVPALFYLFSLLSFHCEYANAQSGAWVRQRVGSFAWLHSVFFHENRGWAVGSNGTLLVTVDGGKSWQIRPRPTADVLRDIYFTDDHNGWLLCEVNLYDLKAKDEPRTYLMQTTDGGEHWKRIDIKGVDANTRLVRTIVNSGRIWVFGEEGTIFTSTDSGLSWTRLQSPTRHLLLGGYFVDEYRGWLVGAGSTIIQTADGGESWHVSRLAAEHSSVRFGATTFVDNRSGWVVGSGGGIYHTENGGRTWQKQSSGTTTDLFDVKFIDALEGWAVGDAGTIIYTNDGGLHWVTQRSDTEHALERVFFAERKRGWAVGFGGTLVSYGATETHP